ncbi:UTRA domain-containing protein [Sphingobacterium sp. DK4209]|uniref:UTRA domain-containing protein n=1 Tax=Sphingobacterium zhuxiongii TaxID=2662364 RepID=A0A5Q0Q7Z6_9SPHI|nr:MULTISPECIES: GntR family transcriptional regulator [unclassified Sphingobacterium]MVZ66227.1 UTRA domain-containing protein [Sphingobacterium sp. DK4209]QGA24951.1 UTRA domain-containing protein [Sphingobacterium sp. dk4302]
MQRSSGTPLYKQVFEELKSKIDSGLYKMGDLLPSENELCKMYFTTRPTVRQALNDLSNLGYIVRQHGKGSIVSEPKNGLGILSLKGSTAGVGKHNLKTAIITKPIKQLWPEAFEFELTPEEKEAGAIYLSRLRYVDGLPTLFEETYISNIDLPRFTLHNLEKNSLFDTLKNYHDVEVKEGEQKIWAIEASKELAEMFDIKAKKPVLHMKRRLKTNKKNLFIYSFLYCNTQDFFIQDYF